MVDCSAMEDRRGGIVAKEEVGLVVRMGRTKM